MDWHSFFIILVVNLSLINVVAGQDENVPFWQNYGLPWGTAHVQVLDHNRQVQLSLDQFTGSAGFKSLQTYGSGWFSMKIKMPQKDSTGVITTFYLRSSDEEKWDEIDFELLGGNGKERPYIVHTNLITNGEGGREQRFHLWFDPTADFHNYTLLWNSRQVVWFVDGKPVRVFKNRGSSFPRQALSIIGTIWNGTWASGGVPVNWNDGPFVASYTGFGATACTTHIINDPQCNHIDSSKYWWSAVKYWSLDPLQKKIYDDVRSKYMFYDYCFNNRIPECHVNHP